MFDYHPARITVEVILCTNIKDLWDKTNLQVQFHVWFHLNQQAFVFVVLYNKKTQRYTCWKQNLPWFSKKQRGVFDLTTTLERSCYNKGLWMRACVVSLCLWTSCRLKNNLVLCTTNKWTAQCVENKQSEFIKPSSNALWSIYCVFVFRNNTCLFTMTSIKRFLTGFKRSMVDSLPASGRSVSRYVHHNIWPQDYS